MLFIKLEGFYIPQVGFIFYDPHLSIVFLKIAKNPVKIKKNQMMRALG